MDSFNNASYVKMRYVTGKINSQKGKILIRSMELGFHHFMCIGFQKWTKVRKNTNREKKKRSTNHHQQNNAKMRDCQESKRLWAASLEMKTWSDYFSEKVF